MRLISFYVSNYKNLNEFNIEFSKESFLEVFVGKNGSGKSNFIEALVDVFKHIYEYDLNTPYEIYYSYKVSYIIDKVSTTIEFNPNTNQLTINGNLRETIGSTPSPENILIYYAGHNLVINKVINDCEAKFSSRIKNADYSESRKFIGINRSYNDLFLTIFTLLPDSSPVKEFVLTKLGIYSISDSIKINLKRPIYASSQSFDIQDSGEYWKVSGIAREFIDDLVECRLPDNGQIRTEGYLANSDTYQLYCSKKSLQKKYESKSALELFRAFDNIKTLGMLESLSLTFYMDNGQEIDTNSFSDGQFQTIYLFAISEIFKKTNSITLMDEPDSFLHPEWQADCSSQIQSISSEAVATNHVLMTTHSAVTLIKSPHAKIRYFDNIQGNIKTYTIPKNVAINRLCSNVIKYTEQEQMLSVLNAIVIERKPVLFTEGSSDPLIIKTAWYKLYPNAEMPFIPFYAFSCSYINQLITDQRIHNEMDGRPIFALLDFDEAYNQWKSLDGEILEENASLGLVKKWKGGDAYSIMLPIPNNPVIQKLVFKDATLTEHFEGKSQCSIEHLFYGIPNLDVFFHNESVPGGNVIKFKGCKTSFAKDVVNTLEPEAFNVFVSLFNFIMSIISPEDKAFSNISCINSTSNTVLAGVL